MRVGFHVNKSLAGERADFIESLESARELLQEYGITHPAAQIFVHGPRDHHAIITQSEAAEIASYLVKSDIKLYIHGAYPDYPWKKHAAAIAGIRGELRLADVLGASGLVIHLGQEAASREVLLDVLHNIDHDLYLTKRRYIFLEINVVPRSAAIFSSARELAKLARTCKSQKFDNISIGICLDTAHLHSCGLTLSSREEARDFLEDLPDGVKYLLHLNDSASAQGSGKDKHAPIAHGEIWGSGKDKGGLAEIIKWAREHKTTILFERHPDDITTDLKKYKKMIRSPAK